MDHARTRTSWLTGTGVLLVLTTLATVNTSRAENRVSEQREAIRRAVPFAAKVAELVKASSESSTWQQGRYTGMRIAKFQNWLYEQNRIWRFTDGTLCALWVVELPEAHADYIGGWQGYLPDVRREYNQGRHQADAPENPSVPYGANGVPLS